MGNAQIFLDGIIEKDKLKNKKTTEKNESKVDKIIKNISERNYSDLSSTVITREANCGCCEKIFPVKSMPGVRGAKMKYCPNCSGADKIKLRREVKAAGSWGRYNEFIEKVIPFNMIRGIHKLSHTELRQQMQFRRVFNLSVEDITRELRKRDRKEKEIEKSLHQRVE